MSESLEESFAVLQSRVEQLIAERDALIKETAILREAPTQAVDEIAVLRASLEAETQVARVHFNSYLGEKRLVAALLDALRRLTTALTAFGRHNPSCSSVYPIAGGPCDCGFDTALATPWTDQ